MSHTTHNALRESAAAYAGAIVDHNDPALDAIVDAWATTVEKSDEANAIGCLLLTTGIIGPHSVESVLLSAVRRLGRAEVERRAAATATPPEATAEQRPDPGPALYVHHTNDLGDPCGWSGQPVPDDDAHPDSLCPAGCRGSGIEDGTDG
jgi:hypothetical protein